MRPSNIYIGATLQSVMYVMVMTLFSSSSVQISVNSVLITMLVNDNEMYIPMDNIEVVAFWYESLYINTSTGEYVISTVNGIKVSLSLLFHFTTSNTL
jgi:hypothetical protein